MEGRMSKVVTGTLLLAGCFLPWRLIFQERKARDTNAIVLDYMTARLERLEEEMWPKDLPAFPGDGPEDDPEGEPNIEVEDTKVVAIGKKAG